MFNVTADKEFNVVQFTDSDDESETSHSTAPKLEECLKYPESDEIFRMFGLEKTNFLASGSKNKNSSQADGASFDKLDNTSAEHSDLINGDISECKAQDQDRKRIYFTLQMDSMLIDEVYSENPYAIGHNKVWPNLYSMQSMHESTYHRIFSYLRKYPQFNIYLYSVGSNYFGNFD